MISDNILLTDFYYSQVTISVLASNIQYWLGFIKQIDNFCLVDRRDLFLGYKNGSLGQLESFSSIIED